MTWEIDVFRQGEDLVDRAFDLDDALREWFRRRIGVSPDVHMDGVYELDASVVATVVHTFELVLDTERCSIRFDARELPLHLLVSQVNGLEEVAIDLDEVLRVWFRRLLDQPDDDDLFGVFALEPQVLEAIVQELEVEVGPRDHSFFLSYGV